MSSDISVPATEGFNVLVLGSHASYNLEHYCLMALEKIGCKVSFLGYRAFLGRFANPLRVLITRSHMARRLSEPLLLRKFNEASKAVGSKFEPDLLLVIKGEAVLPTTIEWFSRELGVTTALWSPDDPRYFQSLSGVVAPWYDFVFTPSERFRRAYRDIGVTHPEYLPFACEPQVHRPVELSPLEQKELSCDICFVGTFTRRRAKIIKLLEKAGFKVKVWGAYWRYFRREPNVCGPIFGLDLSRAYSAAKMVLNVHEESDLGFKPNMRVFEAPACKSLLISDSPFGIEKHFIPGKDVLCYGSHLELLELASHYKKATVERMRIAADGHKRAYSEHRYDQRLARLLAVANVK